MITGLKSRFVSVTLAIMMSGLMVESLSAAEKQMKAGAFVINITPKKFPVPMSGSMTPNYANQAHDQLSARCLVLDDGQTKIAFCIVDACAILRDICDAAKDKTSKTTGIPTDRICISATHTHSAVTAGLGFQAPDMPAEYRQQLIDQIAAGIKTANNKLAPVQIGWSSADEPRHVFNRRWILKEGVTYTNPFGSDKDRARMNPRPGGDDLDRPAGPTDPQVSVLGIRSPDGKPVALLANYSLHYVGGMPAFGLSADYYGAFAGIMARLLKAQEVNPDFVAMMSNGTSGNINNIDFFHKIHPRYGPYEKIYIVANDVGAAAYKAWQQIQWHDHVPICMAERAIDLATRRPTVDEVTAARETLSRAKRREDGAVTQLADVYANETVNMADFPSTVNVKLQAIRIGTLGIASIACEVFVEVGLNIKARSPLKSIFVIGLANGCNGYLPTAEQHKLGGYETWRARSSYLEVNAASKIESTLLGLLNQIAR
ncbi:MAG: hypothetical protein PHR77_02500 [Kiritimatiellae bacterium]|nr:hypothetical protein [Kiritimatiellia bacterium]MDD5519778.1 hypothetical protein [Kiritimatiellia bacterium]